MIPRGIASRHRRTGARRALVVLAAPIAAVAAVAAVAPTRTAHAQAATRPATAPGATAPTTATAAPPAVITACWVPVSGTVYRIDPSGATAGLPRACLSAAHRAFEWNQQGPAGPPGERGPQGEPGPPGPSGAVPVFNTDFYDLSGPTGPSSGFVARGALGQGSAAVPNGAGARLVWYPRQQAFRAGGVSGSQWDEAKLAQSSFAGGGDTEASGLASTAFGGGSIASGIAATAVGWNSRAVGRSAVAGGEGSSALGDASTAFGDVANASGSGSIAMGRRVTASGTGSIALGDNLTASGAHSVAMGSLVSSNGFVGAMVLGDKSSAATTNATADHQFTGRFANGYRFGLNADASQGCTIDASARMSCTGGVAASAIGPAVVRARSIRYEVSGARTRTEYQSCPAGYLVIGGGVEARGAATSSTGFGDMKVRGSYPDLGNNRWYAEVRNDDPLGPGEMWITVICGRQ